MRVFFGRKLHPENRFPIHESPSRSNPILKPTPTPIPLPTPQPMRAQDGMVTERANGQKWYSYEYPTYHTFAR